MKAFLILTVSFFFIKGIPFAAAHEVDMGHRTPRSCAAAEYECVLKEDGKIYKDQSRHHGYQFDAACKWSWSDDSCQQMHSDAELLNKYCDGKTILTGIVGYTYANGIAPVHYGCFL